MSKAGRRFAQIRAGLYICGEPEERPAALILPLSEEAYEPTQKHQVTPAPVGSVDGNHVHARRA
jgi:hypothetical protein